MDNRLGEQWENDHLNLSHRENSLELRFAVLDFRDPTALEYQYSFVSAGFTVEQLCREMGMSNTQLFRKLKALTNRSANDLIRAVRLERARELLCQPGRTIAEVAYETGFTDPAYFSRLFARETGMTPSEYMKRKGE